MLLSGWRKLNLFASQVAWRSPPRERHTIIPLRLTGGALAVYQHLPDDDKQDTGKITKALRIGFAVDSFTAYEQFVGRRLQHGETVDVFLAELRRLAVPFGELSDKMLACAFVAGLPDTVKQLLRAGSRMEGAGDRPGLDETESRPRG